MPTNEIVVISSIGRLFSRFTTEADGVTRRTDLIKHKSHT